MMAIYRLLQHAAFGPEDVARLTEAYEATLKKLNLAEGNDALNETVAKIIMEIAQTGEKDPRRIHSLAMAQLQGNE
jgi:hypothetical protein